MQEQLVSFRQIYELLRRNILIFVMFVTLFAAAALGVSYYLPKEFKSRSTIGLQATYFRNPLVNEIISEVHDPRELSAQRSALIQLALDDAFIDELGQKFQLYNHDLTHPLHSLEREELRNRIEYYAMGPSSFEVNTIAPDAQMAAEMNERIHEQIQSTLYTRRIQILTTTREAIEEHVRSLSKALLQEKKPAHELSETARIKLEQLQAEIAALLQHFTERHPTIQKLRLKEKGLQQKLDALPAAEPAQVKTEQNVFYNSAAKGSVKDIHSELVKKLSNLDLVLAIETGQKFNPTYFSIIAPPTVPLDAFFPDPKKFLLFGALLGGLLGACIVMLREIGREEQYDFDELFASCDLKLLGEIPTGNDERLLELPHLTKTRGVRRRLPNQSYQRLSHG